MRASYLPLGAVVRPDAGSDALARQAAGGEAPDDEAVGAAHHAHRHEEEDDGDGGVVVAARGRRHHVVAPDLVVVEPAARALLAVDGDGSGDGGRQRPDADQRVLRSSHRDVGAHREHHAEEAVASDQRQRQHAGDESEHCKGNAAVGQRLTRASTARGTQQ